MESRLPMFKTKLPSFHSGPKKPEPDPHYVIQLGNEAKISDYIPESDETHSREKSMVKKSGIKLPAKSSKLSSPTTNKAVQKPSSFPEKLKTNYVSNGKSPSSESKPKNESSKGISKLKEAPVSKLRSPISSMSLKPPSSPSKHIVQAPTTVGVARSKLPASPLKSLPSPTKTTTALKPSPAQTCQVKPQSKLPARGLSYSKSESKLASPSTFSISAKRRSSQEIASPSMTKSLSAATDKAPKLQSYTSQSKLVSPSRIASGLRKPSGLKKPLKLTVPPLNKADIECENISLNETLAYPPLCKVLRVAESKNNDECCLDCHWVDNPRTSYPVILDEIVYLRSCDIVQHVIPGVPTSTVTLNGLETCDFTVVQSHCTADLQHPDFNLHRAVPFTAHVSPKECFTYLQQAQPSSYKKKLVNSFAVSEQLSPTAESHARHFAGSVTEVTSQHLPQPWLSADLIDTNQNEVSLIIPEPLAPKPNRVLKSSLHSITESDEPLPEQDMQPVKPKRPCKKAASFSLTQGIAREQVDELITQYNNENTPQDLNTKPSSGLFSSLLSKIGGRRILSRPQESPPRARRFLPNPAAVKGEIASRRKWSPTLRRRSSPTFRRKDSVMAGNCDNLKQSEQTSPKHKPVTREDSPIRSKEAYYGGTHCHMPINILEPQPDNYSQNTSPDLRIGATVTLGSKPSQPAWTIHCGDSETPNSHERMETHMPESNDRDDHMKFYSSRSSTASRKPVSTSSRSHSSRPAVRTNSLKMPYSNSHKNRSKSANDEMTLTHFSPILRMGLPPCPDINVNQAEQGNSAISKVSVGVRLKPAGETNTNSSSYISADASRAQLILRDPSNEANIAPSCRRQMAAVPKLFAFDSVFGCDAMQMDVCKSSLIEILQSVLQGTDGCVTSFGQSKTGKSQSLVGVDSSCAEFGIIPTALSWLYHLIESQRTKTGARFSIRISALEIRGKNEQLTDLLSDCAADVADLGARPSGGVSEEVKLTNTAVYGAQIDNLSELRAPDAEAAGYFLDSALTKAQHMNDTSDSAGAHFLFTLHIYQHNVEARPSPGGALVAGGRSRLHFVDIGPCAKSSSDGSALTLAALGSTITALLNGQRNFPHSESKLATLLKDSVGHPNCKTCILVHVSTQPSQYTETLQILQLAARIHRMKVRRKNKISSNSSDDTGSTNSNLRRRRGIRMGTSASLSDPDVSSSEQSIDTVIFVPGKHHKHIHRSPAVYRTNPMIRQNTVPIADNYNNNSSPYSISGAVKKRVSDDETSSEGRRRMPRTNARVWPRANSCDKDPTIQKEIWLDSPPTASRDQWHIPGNANPIPHYNTPQHQHNNYYALHDMTSNETAIKYPHQPQQQQQMEHYTQQHYVATHANHMNNTTPWMSLAQYDGPPGSISHVTQSPCHATAVPGRQAWADNMGHDKTGATKAQQDSSKQELWVDGPTAFRKNIEGLTQNLHKDSWSPSRKHTRYHHSGERGDKSKHHHHHHKSTPNRRHHNNKHCFKCGDDIKKEEKTPTIKIDTPSKVPDSSHMNNRDEPTVSVKPFVKDWVLRHSQNNTPVKSAESKESEYAERTIPSTLAQTRQELLEHEMSEQDLLQLTVNLVTDQSVDVDLLIEPPCAENLMNDSSDQDRQDEVHIDDSVSNISNVTSDDRVGFESKDGSSIEDSLGDEIVEVCDAACQTEFTDSDTHSVQSTDPLQPSKNIKDIADSVRQTLPATSNSISRSLNKKEATEAFLNASLQATMLRRPDGASDPNLHKEISSPALDTKIIDTASKIHSNTLPRNTHLAPPTTQTQAMSEIVEPKLQPIKLQPYLSANKTPTRQMFSTIPKHTSSLPQKSPPKQINSSSKSASKPESKLKKPSLIKQLSSDSQESPSKTAASPAKKSKGSKLPGLRFSSKSKDPKPAPSSVPTTPTYKSSDSNKKEKKSFLQPPGSMTKSKTDKQKASSSHLPHPSTMSSRPAVSDVVCSPYRQYVLPRPTYNLSDVCSDNSSCPSRPLADHKHSVSSGYESMTLNSAEEAPQGGSDDGKSSKATEKTTSDPWYNSSSSADTHGSVVDSHLQQRMEEDRKLSEEALRHTRIEELLYQQDLLKREMMDAKNRLMVPPSSWTYDSDNNVAGASSSHLLVASQVERRNDDGYLEALEKETLTLQRRVDACKSRIMLVTSIL